MDVEIREEPPGALAGHAAARYADVPIAFEVRERLAVLAPESGLGGLRLVAERVHPSWIKDYDAAPGEGPASWAARFDVTRWGVLAAWARSPGASARRVGGAVLVCGASDVEMLDRRADLALLWDLRVAPEHRRRGVGAALFAAAESWARARGAEWLKVETQNVNVPACRFYARQGCVLGAVHRFAYPELPNEAQLLWYKRLVPLDAC